MLLVLFIFGIISQIKFASPVCTPNENYGRIANSISEISLCGTADCSTKSKTLKASTVYHHCDMGDNQTSYLNTTMKIQLFNIGLFGSNTLVACLNSAGVWVLITRHINCATKGPLTYSPYPDIQEFYVYVVACNDQEEEFADEDKPRLQISGFDSPPLQGNFFKLMFPSQQLQCVSNCKEVIPTYAIGNGIELVTVRGDTLAIKVQLLTDITAQILVDAKCHSPTSLPRNITFYIANFINASIYSYTEGKPRIPNNMYDAGESISCSATGLNTFKANATGSTPKVTIEVVELDSFRQVVKRFVSTRDQMLTIPENLPSGISSIVLICYFGDYDSNLSDAYYFIERWPISIGARFLTKLKSNSNFDESEGFDFSPGTLIRCDKEYYENVTQKAYSTIQLVIIYGNRTAYPASVRENYFNLQTEYAAEGGIMEFRRKYPLLDMYVYCVLESYQTTPAPIFSADRPKVQFINIHPKWKTDYYLIGFIISCNGSNIESMSLTCLDCLPDSRMAIKKINSNQIQLEVPNTIRKNVIVTYQCSGTSNKFNTSVRNIVLRVIVSHMTSIETVNNLFMYNEDFLSCKATFTVVENKTAVMKSIIVPAMMKIDNSIIINENGTIQRMLLIRNETVISPNKLVIFHGCCSVYTEIGYRCFAWKNVLVARNYHIRYNMDLESVYPGNKLKCYICKNYTSEIRKASCTGVNSIPSKIRMVVVDPVGNLNDTGFVDEVTAPIEGLKPDKDAFYKITDYTIEITCKIRESGEALILHMKSCNINPPQIMITPIDRTMFFAGDIFSCTTDDINCKNGLTYSIFVQKGTDSAERKDAHSFTLTRKHTGNNIKITCAAGEGGLSKDERMIRVETGPYNVSISNIYNVMIYKRFLRCHALGFPFPVISWNQIKGPSVLSVSESFLLIGPWDFSGSYSVQCEAKNERGSVRVSANFQVFNPRISFSDYSSTFYICVPILTAIYLILLSLSLMIIFQESIFLVPFFSGGSYEAKDVVNTKRVSVASQKIVSE